MLARRLALRQLEIDRARTARFPALFAHKISRLCASPLAFLRGAAPLFYEILAEQPHLAEGPEGSGWIQGDTHLENFGAFSPAVLDRGEWHKGPATFHLNDFDEAARSEWRRDVLRLTTSVILSGRELGQDGRAVLSLCQQLLGSYCEAAFDGASPPRVPAPVTRLIDRVEGRSRRKLLEDRTEFAGHHRHFVHSDRYSKAPEEARAAVPAALALFAERTASSGGPKLEHLAVEDVAFRVAGTGSLGALRLAVLTRGKGGDDGNWLFDLKEQVAPSLAVLHPQDLVGSRAAQVEAAFRACVETPPRMLGTSQLGDVDVLVRRLTPQEDKLALSQLDPTELAGLARYLGALLGSAHRRARDREFARWVGADTSAILERAVQLAGLHESIYLELCWLVRHGATS